MTPSRRRGNRGRRVVVPQDHPAQGSRMSTLDDEWGRAGAHNVAGVSFQIAVTAKLLLDAKAGEISIARVTPEGFEDIDLVFRDGREVLVQVKDRAAKSTFARSDLAEALRKRQPILTAKPDLQFILATDARLGEGMVVSGWDRAVAHMMSDADSSLLAGQLAPTFDDPDSVLARTHLVHFERDVAESSRFDLARIAGVAPSVGALAYARVIETVSEIAVRQRDTTPRTAEWITPSDLDALVAHVVDTVDLKGLDEAVWAGIVEPVDFQMRADLSIQDFLAGVDVLPSHVAAGLDIPRPDELRRVIDALEVQRAALIVGPSGCGKSALMWRVARELAGRVRPYRVLRILPDDAPTLLRWVRLQEASQNYPLLLCVDNLGRPATAGWNSIARELTSQPGILLLGASREEDYRPDLVVGSTTLIDPKLSRDLAHAIAETLGSRGVTTAVDVAEAFSESEALLMEFLSMLLTGRRLRQVVEEQVAERLPGERAVEREIIRHVATAHAGGVSLPAAALSHLIPGHDLAASLATLNREHILITNDGDRWLGLHELRSEVARDYLHQFPPPTLALTLRALAEHLPVDDVNRLVEVYARYGADLSAVAEGVGERLTSEDLSARDGARLLTGLAMADAFRHARACLEIVEERRPRALGPEDALIFTYTHRFAGVSFQSMEEINPNFRRIIEMAEQLPDRPQSLRDIALRSISPTTIAKIALQGSPGDAVNWLESLEGSSAARLVPIREIWQSQGSQAPLDVRARLMATLQSLAATSSDGEGLELLGPLSARVNLLAGEVPDCLAADSKQADDGLVVSATLLVPEDDSDTHDRSVETCRLILDLCPEADIAEVIVVIPGGDRLVVGGLEEGHKRIPRGNLRRTSQTTVNANFIRAGRLLLASRYWTEPIRTLSRASAELVSLLDEAPAWLLNPHHNADRRQRAATRANDLLVRLASSPALPAEISTGEARNKALDAVSSALHVIRDIAANRALDGQAARGLGARCRQAVRDVREARHGDLPRLPSAGEPLPLSLDRSLLLLGDLLLARTDGAQVPTPRRRNPETWWDVAQRVIESSASEWYEAEQEALSRALEAAGSRWSLKRLEHTDLSSVWFPTDRWVVLVPIDSVDPEIFSFSARLAEEYLSRLAFRTYVVFHLEGDVVPVRALKLGTSQFWPADADEVQAIAVGLDVNLIRTPNSTDWRSFVSDVVQASRAGYLSGARHQAGLRTDPDGFSLRRESARQAASVLPAALQPEAERLLARVASEVSTDLPTLASEVYRALTDGQQSQDVAAIAIAEIEALELDILAEIRDSTASV